jgi:hypothetical protein
MLMIDPTNSSKEVVHFMIPKDGLISIAENVNKKGNSTSGLINFGLKIGGNVTGRESMSTNMSSMSTNMSSMSTNMSSMSVSQSNRTITYVWIL